MSVEVEVEVGGLVVRLLDLVTAIGIAVGVDADIDAGFFESLLSVMGVSLSAFPMTAIETADSGSGSDSGII